LYLPEPGLELHARSSPSEGVHITTSIANRALSQEVEMVSSAVTRVAVMMALVGTLLITGCGGAEVTEPTTSPETPVTAPSETPATDAGGDAEFVRTKCTMCHEYDRVAAADLDEAGWSEVVTRMQGNGLVVTEEEKARIIEFLAAQ
jgi:cytochrome c5